MIVLLFFPLIWHNRRVDEASIGPLLAKIFWTKVQKSICLFCKINKEDLTLEL